MARTVFYFQLKFTYLNWVSVCLSVDMIMNVNFVDMLFLVECSIIWAVRIVWSILERRILESNFSLPCMHECRTYCFFDFDSAIITYHAVVVCSVRQCALDVPPSGHNCINFGVDRQFWWVTQPVFLITMALAAVAGRVSQQMAILA
jgi:hypothetical protein